MRRQYREGSTIVDTSLRDAQDPDASYVTRWVPELAALPGKWVRTPWAAPAAVLEDAGVALGETYPHRITTCDLRVRLLAIPCPGMTLCTFFFFEMGNTCRQAAKQAANETKPHCM